MRAEDARKAGLISAAALSGSAWLWGGASLAGPALSITLLLWIAIGQSVTERHLVAAAYYLSGSWPIVGAVLGYWGPHHVTAAVGAWFGTSLLLASPWGIPPRRGGLLAALVSTAVPPLGVIGWLSPLTAAGALFPATGWFGIICMMMMTVALPGALHGNTAARWLLASLIGLALGTNCAARLAPEPHLPSGWVGVQTRITPSDGNVLASIQNNQAVISAGIEQGLGARVVVFPEAIVPNWYDGTRAQLSAAVPPGQTWLLGVQVEKRDAIVLAKASNSKMDPLVAAAGLLLGGDWQPWSSRSLRPAWWQPVFEVDGQRVWAAVCVEQVLPWTWLEAMAQRPDVILAQTNAWWAGQDREAPEIQEASTNAWARLMSQPVLSAVNW